MRPRGAYEATTTKHTFKNITFTQTLHGIKSRSVKKERFEAIFKSVCRQRNPQSNIHSIKNDVLHSVNMIYRHGPQLRCLNF